MTATEDLENFLNFISIRENSPTILNQPSSSWRIMYYMYTLVAAMRVTAARRLLVCVGVKRDGH